MSNRRKRKVRVDATTSFAELLELVRAGNEPAMAELWQRFHPRLIRYLRGMCGQDHEDVAANVWVDIANGLNRFSGNEDAFRRWTFTIARRRYIDHVRRSTRQVPSVSTEVVAEPATSGGIEDIVDLDSAMALVQQLPESQRDIVLLRTLGGLSIADVAELLDQSEGSVRVTAHRGLKRLAQIVDNANEAIDQSKEDPS